MCGIFGFVGKNYANLPKVKILGIYNESRGKDSTGYFYQGVLEKDSSFQKKEFRDFIQHYIIKTDENYPCSVFIGHTRLGTKGASTDNNAHPHESENYVIVHNGTIENINDLCDKYEIDHTGILNDSKLLGLLIEKVGFSILSEYIGYAAILVYDKREKNTLYVYHGASKNFESDKTLIEERPLFFLYSKREKGFYFSSLETSLKAIREDESEEIKTLEHNVVIKITANNIVDKITINREFNNVKVKKNTNIPTIYQSQSGRNISYPDTEVISCIDIEQETIHRRYFGVKKEDFIGVNKLRYYTLLDNKQCDGKFILNKQGKIFNADDGDALIDFNTYYFYKGIMLKGEKEYVEICNIINNKIIPSFNILNCEQQYNFALFISKYAYYPICNIDNEGKYVQQFTLKKAWFRSGSEACGSFSPKFCDREYVFKAGKLEEIRNRTNQKEEFLINSSKNIGKFYNQRFLKIDDIKLDSYTQFFSRIWKSKEEIEENCPCTVLLAIKYYFIDVYDFSDTTPTQRELDENIDYFYEICITDKLSFTDNIEKGFVSSIPQYIEKAMKEIGEEEKKN